MYKQTFIQVPFLPSQKHYWVLETLALEHEEEEEITDFIILDVELINRRAGAAIEEFKQIWCSPLGMTHKGREGRS